MRCVRSRCCSTPDAAERLTMVISAPVSTYIYIYIAYIYGLTACIYIYTDAAEYIYTDAAERLTMVISAPVSTCLLR
jgi:hypothetical protein